MLTRKRAPEAQRQWVLLQAKAALLTQHANMYQDDAAEERLLAGHMRRCCNPTLTERLTRAGRLQHSGRCVGRFAPKKHGR